MRPLPTLALLLSLAAAPALAQTAPAGPPRHPDAAQRQARHAEMRLRKANDLALLLDLKPAQRPLLDAFLQASGPPERGMEGKPPMPPEGAANKEPGFEQHLARMEAMSARHAAESAKRLASVRSFYGALDPHQKQLFEALMRLRRESGGHEDPHGGPGRDGPNGGPGGMPHGDGPPPAN